MQLERIRGDTYPDVFTVTNTETKLPANIAGCSFKLSVNSSPAPVDASTQLFQLLGNIVVAEEGTVSFAPSAEQANNVGYYYFDIQMTDSYGQVFTLDKGLYAFYQDITK